MKLDPAVVCRVQELVGETADGILGPKTLAAIHETLELAAKTIPALIAAGVEPVHPVLASSFADPADLSRFAECKSSGKSDQQCFRIGDNGVGKWGNSTAQGTGPCCALPPEDWQHLSCPGLARVLVTVNGRSVVCDLRDTMPKKEHIENGAGIDLNPDACETLGLTPPILVPATWQWLR